MYGKKKNELFIINANEINSELLSFMAIQDSPKYSIFRFWFLQMSEI
jgi:hypothetical protein